MKKFKDLFLEKAFNKSIAFPTVGLTFKGHTLNLRFDSKDTLIDLGYEGDPNPWLSSLCFLMEEKTLKELTDFSMKNWELVFRDDQTFWDYLHDQENNIIKNSLELLSACLDIYRGRDYLYQNEGPLVCRCFGVREADIIDHLKNEQTPTMESLASISKAGMGCRSCVSQLKRWLVLHDSKQHPRYYKHRPVADWLLDIDYMLSCFPKSLDWKMEVAGFKADQVIILYNKDISQIEEEKTGQELHDFLTASLDPDLSFFLRRARHFSKANG
jgi:bacterioferritin-associated ferredoxin